VSTATEIKRLQGCLNSLIAVAKLPSIWSSHEVRDIHTTVFERSESTANPRGRGVTAIPPCGDRVQLQQVILNLVLNARESMRHVHDGQRVLQIRATRNSAQGATFQFALAAIEVPAHLVEELA
jgi:signal transduction histidine kinase